MDAPMNSVRRSLASIVLGFETIVLFLGTLVLYGLRVFEPLGWPEWTPLAVGGVVFALSIVALGTLKHTFGYALGWAVQIAVFVGGVLQPLLFVVGAMFGAMWWYALRAGSRIDRRNAQYNDRPSDS